jgi:lipopolysaccharide biosynthesis protein/glycosyltransferase involved in cell wall biosynthesis
MDKPPKVTVVLTSYNHAKFLHESIDSVLSQTFSDFRLIILDDASTDESWKIIKSYHDPRIVSIQNSNNSSGTLDLAKLSALVSSNYIAIHHSDDVWEPQKLEKQVPFLDNHPEIGAVFTNAMIIGEHGEPFEDKAHFYYGIFNQPNRSRYEWLNFFFYQGNVLCHPSVLIRKVCYENCGLYRPGLAQIPDFDMWIRLCMKYEIHVLPETLVRFRVRANEMNVSGNRPETRNRWEFEFLQVLDNYRGIRTSEEFLKIFPNANKYIKPEGFDIGFALGMIALEPGTSQIVKLFGQQLLFEALNDSDRARKIETLHGFSRKDFIALTAKHDLFSIGAQAQVQVLTVQVAEKEQAAQVLVKQVAEKEQAAQVLVKQVAEKEQAAQVLVKQVAEKEQAMQALTAQVGEREQAMQVLTAQVGEREQAMQALTAQVGEREQAMQALTAQVGEREQAMQALTAQLSEIKKSKAWKIALLIRKIRVLVVPPNSRRLQVLRSLINVISFPFKTIKRNLKLKENLALTRSSDLFDESWYLEHNPDVAQSSMDPARHYLLFGGFEGRDPGPKFSSNWYLNTYPDVLAAKINPLVHYLRFGQQEGRFVPKIETQTFTSHAGINLTLSKAWKVFRREGIRGVFSRLYHKLMGGDSFSRNIESSVAGGESKTDDAEYLRIRAFQVVPYYLDPYAIAETDKIPSTLKIAVHLHLFYPDMLDQCVKYLNNIPVRFDLYVSITEKNDRDEIAEFLQSHINLLNKVILKKVSNRGRDLAPMIIDFGEDLLKHDFVAHIHTNKSPQDPHLNDYFVGIMDTLFGSPSNIYQIFKLLLNDAKFVYPAPNKEIFMEESGWKDNYIPAQNLLPKLLGENIESYPLIEFPQGSMFWATSNAIGKFLKFPLKHTDFPLEPIPPDEIKVHALERLLLISANKIPGRNYRIYSSSSTIDEPYYESQNNYSNTLVHKTVKVLSYYLPQFYAIPENDMWHGKGFTEWDKVRSANPLYYGHYQQRLPHKDLGYYFLNSPDMLKKHAELMKRSGVYGQIFYHYWFSGKTILEKPARMLLADKSIEMPFCFCWANENWTRKWDGNEDEILLGQKYSEQDAIQFINYLIPFFKDERYINIKGRPVLYIYRPSSIPDFELYRTTWQKICAENGIKAPFIVAVLTRGAMSPDDFGMEAGCERVLHDWTDGNVKDIRNDLYPYWPITRSVLNYEEVADYYMRQPAKTDFTYFRSIIPSWDNTPRYGSDAYIVHNSTPEKFQEWLEALIVDAEGRLPKNQRFVIINAWNEWAESAYLEPDSRFGYAYLNSIGRALSAINFNNREYLHQAIPETTQIAISIGDHLLSELQMDVDLRRKIFSCIANATVFSLCNIVFEQPQIAQWMSVFSSAYKQSEKNIKPDYTLHIKDVCYFAPDTIENMLKMALRYDAAVVTPTHLNDKNFTHPHLLKRWETNQISPYMYLQKNDGKRSIKCCVDAGIFISQPQSSKMILDQKVSTIIRFSQSGSLKLLQNALYSLIAQVGCTVQPIINVQDPTDDMLANLETMIKEMPWDDNCYPIIKKYYSTEKCRDLRSLMLNTSLKTAETKYVAFLDYDDIMFHDAYAWLIERLQKTEKNASFGLIYNTLFNLGENKIKTRKVVYDYGKDYEGFYDQNHTPIHGFMLNMSLINPEHIEFYEDMKYMEDYFLTLQIFTKDDTDWESLKQRKFVGDYYIFEDKAQTLANLTDDERRRILSKPDYSKDQARIDALRQRIRVKPSLRK